jgi:hypothetical protein
LPNQIQLSGLNRRINDLKIFLNEIKNSLFYQGKPGDYLTFLTLFFTFKCTYSSPLPITPIILSLFNIAFITVALLFRALQYNVK